MRDYRPLLVRLICVCLFWVVVGAGCGTDVDQARESEPQVMGVGQVPPSTVPGCIGCHPLSLDASHDFPCQQCHGGDAMTSDQTAAHVRMDFKPAHPERMLQNCGGCHPLTHTIGATVHYTLVNEVNATRRAFGAKGELASAAQIPRDGAAGDPLALADDLLRRRCLRCHLAYEGDAYGATRRGTGCAACHLAYQDGKLVSHRFIGRPVDRQCQSCHYGNFVGADYAGRFEHDFGWEYRTPYDAAGQQERPWGVEYHELQPDVHQQAGLWCVDCHSGVELKGDAPVPDGEEKCRWCHDPGAAVPEMFRSLQVEGQDRYFVRADGTRLPIPPLRHWAHQQYTGKVSCAACHARFSFQDEMTHLLRLDVVDYAPWSELTVQGSSEVEMQMEDVLAGGDAWGVPVMLDKLNGEPRLGVWQKGYGQRRWEKMRLRRDEKGVLKVCRPLLSLALSHVDHEGEVVADAMPADASFACVPYQPHTIGRAGAFWRQRLRPFLDESEK